MRILVVEDDKVLGEAVVTHLTRSGHAVDWFEEAVEAELALDTTQYDVVLLDLGLPDGSGLDVLSGMRTRGNHTPVIVATARDRIASRIAGLEAGADDYVVKPYDLNELTARINAIARRSVTMAFPDYKNGDVSIDLASRTATLEGQTVSLTVKEWAVLELLLARVGTLVSKDDLESRMYQFGAEVDSNAVEVFVSRIRKKLGHDLIRTERGLGYMLVAS